MKKIILIFIISFSSLLAKDCTELREDMIEQFDKVSGSNSQNSYDLREPLKIPFKAPNFYFF